MSLLYLVKCVALFNTTNQNLVSLKVRGRCNRNSTVTDLGKTSSCGLKWQLVIFPFWWVHNVATPVVFMNSSPIILSLFGETIVHKFVVHSVDLTLRVKQCSEHLGKIRLNWHSRLYCLFWRPCKCK